MNNKPRYNPQIHHRRSIRLRGYDYAQVGAYFITICTHNREWLFGDIIGGEMRLNVYGKIVEHTWNDLVNHVANIELDVFVVMPNHVHGIVVITDNVVGAGSERAGVGAGSERVDIGAGSEPAPTSARVPLSEIVRQLKTFSARRINDLRQTRGTPVWQRNYWEHIIRNETAYHNIATYIVNNPARWEQDQLYAKI